MKTLIIYANPDKTGYCGQYLKELEKKLKEKKQNYEIIDLYEDKFNPVLSLEEHYTSGHKKISKEILNYQKKITESNSLIFIYPNWWNSVPAILKGFFDRTLTPGFAYKYINKIPNQLLKNKKAIILSSTGAPKIYDFFIMKSRFIKTVKINTLNFCGIKTKSFVIYSANKLTDKHKQKIKKKVEKGIYYLFK